MAAILARELELPYSVSAHARDVFVPDHDLGSLCRGSNLVTVCSRHAETALRRAIPGDCRDRVHYLPHGIDLADFPFLACEPRAAGALRVLTVGRLVAKKGIDLVLEAAALLEGQGLEVELQVVGAGVEAARLAGLSQRLGLASAHFRGELPMEQVKECYRWADVLVMGSRVDADEDRDGIPNVILEAMALGVPVIAADAGGVSEVVRPGRSGTLVSAESAAALAAALADRARQPEPFLAAAATARSMVEAEFDQRVLTRRLLSLLSNAA